MIIASSSDEKKVFDYIGNQYSKCAYLYIDLVKYGFNNENIHCWYQEKDGEVTVLVMMYYTGMHVFSRENVFDAQDVASLIAEKKPSLVCGMGDTINQVKPFVSTEEYEPEYGDVVRLDEYNGIADDSVYVANEDEINEVAALLATDEELGGPYGYELLYKQLLERFRDHFGRSWIRRDDTGIISTTSTYAENDKLAIISGAMVRQDRRGRGIFASQLGKTCKDLINEDKEVISYLYDERAKRANYKVGFRVLGQWAKLIRK